MSDIPPQPPLPPEYPPQPSPPPRRRGSIWLGIGIGVAAAALLYFGGLAFGSAPNGLGYIVVLWLFLPVALLIGGIVLVLIPATRRTGAGLLISVGAVVLITGGVCVALLSSYGSM